MLNPLMKFVILLFLREKTAGLFSSCVKTIVFFLGLVSEMEQMFQPKLQIIQPQADRECGVFPPMWLMFGKSTRNRKHGLTMESVRKT